jgi:phosphoribosyl-ATP pyrophosphohydrolase/phosphoribosyl-AMP cyclohydrolase
MPEIQLDQQGLVPAIVQNAETDEVIMLGYMNPSSIQLTMETGEVWFYSRSRSELWRKGEVSGNYLKVRSMMVDCDADTILIKVDPHGPSCHTGEPTCFFTQVTDLLNFVNKNAQSGIIEELFATIQDRKLSPNETSYTSQLLSEGVDRISQKVIEEAGELAIAGVKGEKDEIVNEGADLIYHILVLLTSQGVKPSDIWTELHSRRKQ